MDVYEEVTRQLESDSTRKKIFEFVGVVAFAMFVALIAYLNGYVAGFQGTEAKAIERAAETQMPLILGLFAGSGILAGIAHFGLPGLHEQYEDTEGRRVLFECDECGFVSLSLGSTHAHCERHSGYTRFGIQVPFTRTAPANVDELMRMTNVIAVSEETSIGLEDVEGL